MLYQNFSLIIFYTSFKWTWDLNQIHTMHKCANTSFALWSEIHPEIHVYEQIWNKKIWDQKNVGGGRGEGHHVFSSARATASSSESARGLAVPPIHLLLLPWSFHWFCSAHIPQHGLHSSIITKKKKHMHENQNKAKKRQEMKFVYVLGRMVRSMCWANIYFHCKTESSTMKLHWSRLIKMHFHWISDWRSKQRWTYPRNSNGKAAHLYLWIEIYFQHTRWTYTRNSNKLANEIWIEK